MRKSNLVSNRTENENAPIATRFRLNKGNFFTVPVRYHDCIYKDSDISQRQLSGYNLPPQPPENSVYQIILIFGQTVES
jgi:hypothetical protein